MAIYTKIFFQFLSDKVFWDTRVLHFLYASSTYRYYVFLQLLDHEDFFPGSGLFFVTVVTDQSKVVEKQDDETTKPQILTVLRPMYGEGAVPESSELFYPR